MKVYPKIRARRQKGLQRDYYETAQIKIEGNYLLEAGFLPNTQVDVQISECVILITKIN